MAPEKGVGLIITVATKNPNKVRELQQIAAENRLPVTLALRPDAPDVEETGQSMFENALLKARQTPPVDGGEWVLGEDSGLEIAALDGQYELSPFPGIYSNRWMTPVIRHELLHVSAFGPATPDELNRGILSLMNGVADRQGKYVCHMVLYRPADKMVIHSCGSTGVSVITDHRPRGGGGFGYDPIMLAMEAQPTKTMAELAPEEKNRISHRGRAFIDLFSKIA